MRSCHRDDQLIDFRAGGERKAILSEKHYTGLLCSHTLRCFREGILEVSLVSELIRTWKSISQNLSRKDNAEEMENLLTF